MYSIGDASIMVVIVACLMIIGSLAYYFNSRIINLEKTIVKQNHVLTDFISNVKNTMLSCEEIVPQEIIQSSRFSEKIGVSDSDDSHTCGSDSSSNFEDNCQTIEITPLDNISGMIELTHQQSLASPVIFEIDDDEPKHTIKLGDLENVEQLDNLSSGPSSRDGDGTDAITSASTSIDFKKMKLTQLRDIASAKGIEVKGKKKTDLVETLNKQ